VPIDNGIPYSITFDDAHCADSPCVVTDRSLPPPQDLGKSPPTLKCFLRSLIHMIINAMSCQARPREKADPSLISCPLQLRDRPQTLLRFGHRVFGGQSHLHDHHIRLIGSTTASPNRLLDHSSPWQSRSSLLNTKSGIVSNLTSFALNSPVY
jgi:hypothetical protein